MKVISTPEAPEAIGPYAQAIEANGFIFCSGQIAIDPASGEVIDVADPEMHMKRILLNLRAVLEAAGSGLDKVVKTTLFLTIINDFPVIEKVYAEMFGDHRPAHTTVYVTSLPEYVSIALEAIALK